MKTDEIIKKIKIYEKEEKFYLFKDLEMSWFFTELIHNLKKKLI